MNDFTVIQINSCFRKLGNEIFQINTNNDDVAGKIIKNAFKMRDVLIKEIKLIIISNYTQNMIDHQVKDHFFSKDVRSSGETYINA